MTPRHCTLPAFTIAIAVAALGTVGSAGKTVSYGVKAAYADTDTDSVRSDNSLYPTPVWNYAGADYQDGSDNTLERLASSGANYAFDLQASTGAPPFRQLCFDFNANNALVFGADPSTSPNTPDQGPSFCRTLQGGMIAVTAGLYPEPLIPMISMTTATGNNTTIRRFGFTWTENGYVYHFNYNRDVDGDGVPDSNPVTIVCVANNSSNTGCAQWTVTGSTATLSKQKVLNKGGSLGSEVWIGTYSMPFTLSLALK